MKKQKKLSIVVPIYNVEKYLEKCVKSICNNAPEDCEIILVDDGSTDDSGNLADKLATMDKKIVVLHKENGGLSDARNYGIKNSTGEYILFIDSDDYVDENFKQVEKNLDGENQIVWIGYIVEKIREQKTIKFKNEKLFVGDEIKKAIPCATRYNSACTKIIQRKFLEENNLYFEKGFAEDFNWTGRILCHAEKIYLSNLCYYHYIAEREGSIMNVYKKQRFYDLIEHSKSIYNEFNKCEISKARRKQIEEYVGSNLIRNFARIKKFNKEEQKEILKLIKENEKMFSKQGKFITKTFYLFAKIFGYNFAYKIAQKFLNN